MKTLWDLLKPARRARGGPGPARQGAEVTDHGSETRATKTADHGSETRATKTADRGSDSCATKADDHGSETRATEAADYGLESRATRMPMAVRYERMQREMLSRYGVRVRKWRSSMSGVAWQVTYADGTVSRLIESPRPKGPVSAAIFLHEIGHHAIGLGAYRPRCLEEYHAWMFSLAQMEAWELNITESVHRRVRESLEYAVWKGVRRGMKRVPRELAAYVPTATGVTSST